MPMNKMALLVVGVLLLASGGFAFTLSVNQVWLGLSSEKWPATKGIISRSMIELRTGQTGLQMRDAQVSNADIRYTYKTGDQIHVGDKITVLDYLSKDLVFEKRLISRYPAGSFVKVYYDPDNPELSVLEPGANWFSFLALVLGAVIVITGVFLLTTWWRKKE